SSFLYAPATPPIYPLSLHDALPISGHRPPRGIEQPSNTSRAPTRRSRISLANSNRTPVHFRYISGGPPPVSCNEVRRMGGVGRRSEEHTSELQSLTNLVCRLLLQKK